MTCRLSVLGFLLALAACSTARDGHDDAIHLVQRIYTLPDPYFEAFHDPEIRPDFFTARIDALTRKAVACYQEIWQMDHLDFDPIVPGQDYDIRHFTLTETARDAKTASIDVSFFSMNEEVWRGYELVRTPQGWRIDEVRQEMGETLTIALERACTKPLN